MRRLIMCAAVVLCTAGPNYAAIRYSVTDLGDLPGGEDFSHPMAVNSTGQVVGVSETADGRRAFLWTNGVMTDLGTLTGEHHYSYARDINDAGEIVGTSGADDTVGNLLTRRPFLYSDGSMTVLTGFEDYYGEARGINNASEVVGNSHYSHGAFLYSGGVMTDLGSLGGIPDYSGAYGINDFTQVVGGISYTAEDAVRGVLWEDGTMTDLGDLPGGPEETRAYDINNLGQVVGNSGVPSSTLGHAFLWENGVMTDLGVWPGTDSSLAEGINNSGLAVGTSFNYDPITNTGQDHRAFVWDSTNGMQDLNSVLDSSGTDWTLKGCRDISNAGHIVGWGTNPDGSQLRGFLLTPISEPSVVGRHTFYNNSAFDSVADLTDDDAIAPDKQALLPGETADFENYTSYASGINGIMVDIANLTGTPTVDDFEFKVGNDDTPNDWEDAPDPSDITVWPGEGDDGSDRITILWGDNAIEKEWLQVTVLANEETGLDADDVFYFGNAIGEIGNSETDTKVNAIDMLGARNNPHDYFDAALIDDFYDFDRDAKVNATDMLIARDNTTNYFNALKLISVPGGGKGVVPEPSTFALLAMGAAGLLGWKWRRYREIYCPKGKILPYSQT